MSVERRGGGWRVRWREGGRQRSRTFTLKRDAEFFDAETHHRLDPDRVSSVLRRPRRTTPPRYLYVVRAGDLLKIGITNNVDQRVAAIQAHCPVPVALVRVIETEHAAELELNLHDDLADFRSHGEWFTDADRLVEAFGKVTDTELLAEVTR